MNIRKLILHPVFGAVMGLITCSICLNIILKSCNDKFGKEETEMKLFIGKEVILDKDTLTIINYSVFDAEFTLSNGVLISKNFAMRTILNDSIESVKK